MAKKLRLGVNIDHIATLRNARGGIHPDPVQGALLAETAGADGITAHLREDRRHIKDDDMRNLKSNISKPLNFEMAVTDEMLKIAIEVKPNACCLVPEKREEVTTEGGLNVADQIDKIKDFNQKLQANNILVSLFIDADETQIRAAKETGADIIEIHVGPYAHACDANDQAAISNELEKIVASAKLADELGLEVHAGHGIDYKNVAAIAEIPQIVELNIGHFLMGEAIFVGLDAAVKKMRKLMDESR